MLKLEEGKEINFASEEKEEEEKNSFLRARLQDYYYFEQTKFAKVLFFLKNGDISLILLPLSIIDKLSPS